MRERPFIAAGEQPRPYSEILAERRLGDPEARRREQLKAHINEIEGEAADAIDPAERKRLQCDAEALRLELDRH